MALYAKFRAWVIWLFWFYIRYGKEMSGKKAIALLLASVLVLYFAYESMFGEFSKSKFWTFEKLSGYVFLILLPPSLLGIYGYVFGRRHKLEKLDPVYTRPSPLEPIGFFLAMLIIGLARVNGWW